MFETAELVEYSSATRLAAVYQASVARIQSLIVELGEECDKLQAAYQDQSPAYGFRVGLHFDGRDYTANHETATVVAEHLKRRAWGTLIERLGICKIMSSARVQEWHAAIRGDKDYRGKPIAPLPPIDEETIMGVLHGMVQSADEFMSEAVTEEYEWWKPNRTTANYKRNSEFRLMPRVIRPWMVESDYRGGFRPQYSTESHLTALDMIFHRLDGKGFPPGHYGPLSEAIRMCGPEGKGATDLFAFKCYKNGNLHLQFLRLDLLERFNQIAGRARLPDSCD